MLPMQTAARQLKKINKAWISPYKQSNYYSKHDIVSFPSSDTDSMNPLSLFSMLFLINDQSVGLYDEEICTGTFHSSKFIPGTICSVANLVQDSPRQFIPWKYLDTRGL